jgi:hypothetical protein
LLTVKLLFDWANLIDAQRLDERRDAGAGRSSLLEAETRRENLNISENRLDFTEKQGSERAALA